ncbi:EF-hand domain-containing protein [Histidinibacterium aquaticum]|nr:EF-hand domain-containing protein [Histidinibacterium aquaticum]
MTRTTLSVFALAAAGMAPAAFAQDGTAELGDYCQNAFYAGDQNADAQLSDSELQEMRNAVYEQIDANQDGTITREEFANCETMAQEANIEKIGETWGPDQNRAAASMMGDVWPGIGPEAAEPVVPDDSGSSDQASASDTEGMAEELETSEEDTLEAGDNTGVNEEDASESAEALNDAETTGDATESAQATSSTQMTDEEMSRDDFMSAANTAYEENILASPDDDSVEPNEDWAKPFIFLGEGESASDLSAEEFASRAAYTFETTDADGNDALSQEEYLNRSDVLEVDAEEINQRFDAMDANADGSISQEEFNQASESRSSAAADAAGEAGMSTDAGVPVIYYFFYQRS